MNYIDQYNKNGFFILRNFTLKIYHKILNKINSLDTDKYENSKEKNGMLLE